MHQPGPGAVPPPMASMFADQQSQQLTQVPPTQQQPQPWMIPPHQQQPQPVPPPAGWNQQLVPSPQLYGAASAVGPDAGSDGIRSLWIGDLQQWMDENYLMSCFAFTGEVVSAKVIRNKQTGILEGFGFIEFVSHAAAERILQTYNGALMPSTEQSFRLNWATLNSGERRQDDGPDFTIFVGDLAADVSDYILQETFTMHYKSVKGAKVVTDKITGRSKGYGFVRFGDEKEQLRAITEMTGVYCSSRPMRIGPAASKKFTAGLQYQQATYSNAQGSQGENDPSNTTIFVGNLDPSVTDDMLRSLFGQYGDLVHVKIPLGKRCGFVQFANRASAVQALSMLNGSQLAGQSIRLSWGRNTSQKQFQSTEQGQWSNAYYPYGQGYDPYTYAPPTQDPNMYYGGYPGYGAYQQPPQ